MKVEYTFDSEILTIRLIGQISTDETDKMNNLILQAVSEYPNFRSIVFDASQLEYLCSLALRVILRQKKDYGDVSVIGANAEIYNVFKMTGFTKMMNIEKALPQVTPSSTTPLVNMPGLFPLAQDTMVKVFPAGTTRSMVDEELTLGRELFAQGLPTSMTFEVVKVADRYGLIYERPVGEVLNDPKVIGQTLRTLHERDMEVFNLPSLKQRHQSWIDSLTPHLGEEVVRLLTKINEAVPEYVSLLHGNLAPQTLLLQDGELLLSTPGTVTYGHPMFDLAHLYSKLNKEQKKDYFNAILQAYYHDVPTTDLPKLKEQIAIMALVESFLKLATIEAPDDEQLAHYRSLAKEYVIDKWDEIASRLKFKVDFRQEIRKLVKQHFYTNPDVNIDWLATTLGTNRHYVSDYFNKVLHKSFNDFINDLRLDYAVTLIRSGKEKPTQIPYAAGFNNDHTFRRLFKERFGQTPSQFK